MRTPGLIGRPYHLHNYEGTRLPLPTTQAPVLSRRLPPHPTPTRNPRDDTDHGPRPETRCTCTDDATGGGCCTGAWRAATVASAARASTVASAAWASAATSSPPSSRQWEIQPTADRPAVRRWFGARRTLPRRTESPTSPGVMRRRQRSWGPRWRRGRARRGPVAAATSVAIGAATSVAIGAARA